MGSQAETIMSGEAPRPSHAHPGRKTVYKYIWPIPNDRAVFQMPRDAEVLCVHEQDNQLCLWARVVEGRHLEPRPFILCGTGHDAPDLEHRYIGTAHLAGGRLVLHVFEPIREDIGHA